MNNIADVFKSAPKPIEATPETISIPEIFPSEEKIDLHNPWVRLLVIDKSTAGPGLMVLIRAIPVNNIQVDSSIVFLLGLDHNVGHFVMKFYWQRINSVITVDCDE